jgi:hypothetical protein
MPHPLEHARRLASGTAATLGLLALLAIVPPAGATVSTVSVSPPAPGACDSVTITVSGNLPDDCYQIVGATIRGPEPSPCMRPTPCPSTFAIEITVRGPNLAILGPCSLVAPYTRSFNVGRLPTGPYDVLAHEKVTPFETDSIVSESFASGSFTVGPDSVCAGTPGCFLLGFVPDRAGVQMPIDPQCTASAPPGGTACLDLALTNSRSLGGLQVTLEVSPFDPPVSSDAILQAVSVDPIGRAAGFQVGWAADGSRTKFLLYSTSGASITPGYGPVIRICYAVPSGAVSQRFHVFDTAALAADPAGDSIPPCPTFAAIPPGVICVGTKACDVNGDGFTDVLDIIRLVRCALASPGDSLPACPDSIAARADCNGDGAVDIRDVIRCVRKIVGIQSGSAEALLSQHIDGNEVSIGFEGAPRWTNAVEGTATIRIDAAENWGGAEFVLHPLGAPVLIRGLSLDTASAREGTHLEWAVDGSGIAHAMLYETTPGARAAHSYKILVSLERSPSGGGSGTIRIQAVTAGTSEGVAAGASTFNPSVQIDAAAVAAPALFAARPNPSAGQTEIAFVLPADSRVTLHVYDVAGRLVRTLVDGTMPAGVHRAGWNGADDRGRAARSGLYFAKLEVGKTVRSERILLLR